MDLHSHSLLQEWAIRVAEEADTDVCQTPPSSRSARAPPAKQMNAIARPDARASKSCLGLEGDTFPPSYDDDGAFGSNADSIPGSASRDSPTRQSPYAPTKSALGNGPATAAGATSAGGSEKCTSSPNTAGVYMRARPLLWSVDDVARESTSVTPTSSPRDREDLPPWRRPSITRCAFPPATVPGKAPQPASRHSSIPNPSAQAHPATGRAYDDAPPSYAEMSMSPQMCPVPGAYPPSFVAAEAPQCRPPSYPPSPTAYRQRCYSDLWRSSPPAYSSAVQSCSAHLPCDGAAAGLGLTIQQAGGPYPSSTSPLPACPHSHSSYTHVPIQSSLLGAHSLPHAMHVTIALQPGCAARKHSAASYGSFLLPLAAAILLFVSLSFGVAGVLSCGAGYGSRASSSNSSSVHASLIWRALSSLLSYVFRVLGDGDGKL
ncbi:hypothetical protein C8T65DRAFT_745126 [Cerioporus squamosus]|nr:hypothetical protein C8T65DRAFT_745126 [Cerioporus squamosus]